MTGSRTPARAPRRRPAARLLARGHRRRRRRASTAAGASVGVLTGGRLTVENAYGYAKFARAVLGTNNVDFRSRPALRGGGRVPRRPRRRAAPRRVGHLRRPGERRPTWCSSASSPRTSRPIVFLRLRKAVRKNRLKVTTLAPFASRGSEKLAATRRPRRPGRRGRGSGRAHRPRRRHGDPGGGARRERSPACSALSRPRLTPRAPASRGSRAAPATSARSRPAASPGCCPVGAR